MQSSARGQPGKAARKVRASVNFARSGFSAAIECCHYKGNLPKVCRLARLWDRSSRMSTGRLRQSLTATLQALARWPGLMLGWA